MEESNSRRERPGDPSPYGALGEQLGRLAAGAADILENPPSLPGTDSREWLDSDHEALQLIAGFAFIHAYESLGFDVGTEATSYSSNDLHYRDNLRNLTRSLPFAAGEQDLLMSLAWDRDTDEFPLIGDALRAETGEPCVDAGRLRAVDGDDMADRFWAWRRSAFEFEGGHGLALAVESLRSVAQILLRNDPQAAGYRH